MLAIWRAAVEEIESGRDFVIATITDIQGSSPRHVGTRFLIKSDGSIVGTIGGGLFEASVQDFATEALKNGTTHRAQFSFRGADAAALDMICGGDAEVLVEHVRAADPTARDLYKGLLKVAEQRRSAYYYTDMGLPVGETGHVRHLLVDTEGNRIGGFPGEASLAEVTPNRRLLKPGQMLNVPDKVHPVFLQWLRPTGTVYIFGAGHVGQCVARLAAYVHFRVVVLDDREEFASPDTVPDAHEIIVLDDFGDCFRNLPIDEESYLIVVTRGHSHDKIVLAGALRTPARYVGMIGSRRKTELIFRALLEEGYTQADIERVHAPIGIPIGGETPEEIAVSILAQMIQERSKSEGK